MEYCNNGVWGTVCRSGWGAPDATVVCRQLGHSTFGKRACILTCVIGGVSAAKNLMRGSLIPLAVALAILGGPRGRVSDHPICKDE